MARVEALESFREDVEPRLRAVERDVPTPEYKRDLETRIRALESWFLRAAGAITVLTFLASLAGAAIVKWLGH